MMTTTATTPQGPAAAAPDLYGVAELPCPTAEEMAELDRAARERWGVPEAVLMEAAGRAVAQVVATLFPRGRVVAAVGTGHNGGDALVAARTLHAWGWDVQVLEVVANGAADALRHGWSLPVRRAQDARAAFECADVIVDGILGTGARGAPRAPHAAVIEAMNAAGRPVVAVDGPSGIDFTTGAVPGPCVRAAVTVALGYPKRGCLLMPGRAYCGRLLVAEIGFPPPGTVSAQVLTPGWATTRLPPRPPDAHKGSAGYLLVVAGSTGMAGAAALCARAALRAGAGLVRIASDAPNREILQSLVPEAVFVDAGDVAAVKEALEWADALVVGPGLGRGTASRARLALALERSVRKPVLLDADALNILSERAEELERLGAERPVAMTPHPGEASRLTGDTVAEIRANPLSAAEGMARRYHAAVLLKGAPSVVAAPGLPTLVNSAGTSAVATGGSGDVLAGACGAMLAGGLAPREALAVGLFFAGRAAECLDRGRGATALDLAEALPGAFAHPGASAPPPGLPFVLFDQPPRR
jgi:hydroxyethylthiazole kinase-like uncharacterized protein yjeF